MNNVANPTYFHEGQIFHHMGMDNERIHMSWAWVAEQAPPGSRWHHGLNGQAL